MFFRISGQRLLVYSLIVVFVALVGFFFMNAGGFFRKTEILETQFQTTDLTQVKMVTVLARDSIDAIKVPQLIGGVEGASQLDSEEMVIGVSINGDHRAYPLRILSRHEIVDDVVGRVPIAVTY